MRVDNTETAGELKEPHALGFRRGERRYAIGLPQHAKQGPKRASRSTHPRPFFMPLPDRLRTTCAANPQAADGSVLEVWVTLGEAQIVLDTYGRGTRTTDPKAA